MWRSFSAESYEGRCFASTQKFKYWELSTPTLRRHHTQTTRFVHPRQEVIITRLECLASSWRRVMIILRWSISYTCLFALALWAALSCHQPRILLRHCLIEPSPPIITKLNHRFDALCKCSARILRSRDTSNCETHFTTTITKPQQQLHKSLVHRPSHVHLQETCLDGAGYSILDRSCSAAHGKLDI